MVRSLYSITYQFVVDDHLTTSERIR